MGIKNFKITFSLLLLFLFSPLYSKTTFLKFNSQEQRIFPFSKRFYNSVARHWPSSEKKYSLNVAVDKHGEQLGAVEVQWNIFSKYGVGRNESSDSIVAVIDTGVTNHFSFSDRLLPGVDMVTDLTSANDGDGRDMNAEDPGDYLPYGKNCSDGSSGASYSSWHGTHVAGIIAMNDSVNNFSGASPSAQILPIRVLGSCGGTLQDVLDGILWAIGRKVGELEINSNIPKVLNLSLGAIGECPAALQEVLEEVYQENISVIVSSGNSGFNTEEIAVFPSGCKGVVSVSATNIKGSLSSYSNYGGDNNVYAPGGDYYYGIISSLNTGTQHSDEDSYGEMIGTSMAAPHVSAILANLSTDFPDVDINTLKDHLVFFYRRTGEVVNYEIIKKYIEDLDDVDRGVSELESEGGEDNHSNMNGGVSKKITSSAAGCGSISNDNNLVLFVSMVLNFMIYYLVLGLFAKIKKAHSKIKKCYVLIVSKWNIFKENNYNTHSPYARVTLFFFTETTSVWPVTTSS